MIKTLILAFLATATLGFAQTYQESGGLVVMEMENTPSPLGLWQKQTSLANHSGTGYLQFLGNTYETGPATSPLEYTFKINQAGLYYLHLHCAKETHDGRTDVANDCYVRVEGDYNAGPGPYTSHGNNASLALLQSNTKYFGGATNAWKWENGQNSSGGAGNLDPGGETNKRVAVYDFKAGQTYKLVVSGRSKFFRINRIVFRHTSTSAASAQNLSTPESATVAGGPLTYQATVDFTNLTGGEVTYYKDNTNAALAINASVVADRNKYARAQRTFDGAAGTYNVKITALRELDGECTYRFLVNGTVVGTTQNSTTTTDYSPQTHVFNGITIPAGATIAVESNTHSNGTVPETGGFAWARGRWTTLELSTSTSLVKPPVGRLAYVADGNSPDPDDIGANAVVLGILKGAGLQDRLVHLSHSCDLVKASNISAADELRRQSVMHQDLADGISYFGPFNNLPTYYNCRTDQTAAVNNLRDAINASSASDPLWIIEAGEPDIIGYALQAATASKRQYVHVVSHHPANDDSGDYFTWAQIQAFGVVEHQIGDQNVGLQVLISSGLWDWAQNHSKPGIAWIWNRLKYAEQDGVVAFQTNKFDCSDAGMIYWWLTGADAGGNKNSTPVEIEEMLLHEPGQAGDVQRPVAHWKLDEGSGTTAADSSDYGHNGTLLNGVTWGSDATRGTFVQFDGTNDRISTPFRYTLSSTDDFTWAWWANKQSDDGTDIGSVMVGNRYGGSGSETYEFIKFTPTQSQHANTGDAAEIEKYDYADLLKDGWHHYAMVKSGNTYQWHVDGVAQGAPQTFSYHESSTLPFLIGGDDDGSGTKSAEHFHGFIDDVVLYKRALTANDLLDVRNGVYFPAPPVIEVLAGWDIWDSATTPTASVLAPDVTASLVISAAQLEWNITDARGASNDGTWGGFTSSPTASTAVVAGENLTLPNASTGGSLTFTLTNHGTEDLVLDAFHFDAYAFRQKAARTYALSVLAGGGLSAGNVFASAEDAITTVDGANGNSAHDDIDIPLTGLADHTLGAGESVQFLLAFSSGTGEGTGGHHLFVDNVAFTHSKSAPQVYAPQVNAGLDVSVNLPENQADLTGSATDNGTIVSYLWTQLSGPNTASMIGQNTTNLSIGDLEQGTYTFRLSVTDDEGNTGTDDVSVTVVPETTSFATVTSFTLINADTDQAIPGFDPISNGATINKASVGTTSFNIRVNTSPAIDFGSVVMVLSGATTKNAIESDPVWALFGDVAGDFKVAALNNGSHTLTATPYDQDAGAGGAGPPLTISFTVIDQAGAPTVSAGPDRVVNLPITEVTLDGSATDDASITAYAWTQVSGPGNAFLSGDDTEDLTASSLVAGTYVFRLTATDNDSNQASDDVTVSVVTPGSGSLVVSGELKQWHKVTLMMDGPGSSESATPNPFSDYRMNVTFTHPASGLSYVVPGYFAADGNAADTSATSGNKWSAHLSPDHAGTWNYTVSFRSGTDIALNASASAGTAVTPYDNTSGSFTVTTTDKTGRDHRGKGRLKYVDKHHLQYAGTGEYFLKAGTDAPENLLAYDDIDATPNDPNNQPNLRKSWSPHAGDYDATDAAAYTWNGGKGSELLGAIKYLSDKGVNVFSFLTFSLDGDDDNVFPHLLRGSVADYESVADDARWANATKGVHHDRFDVSKMGQWERIFEYGDKKGMYLHFKTQETENDQLMDGGALGRERKLYYRELVARYGHHLALNWNLGEENTNSDAEVKAFAQWFLDNDPYRHSIVLHTYPLAKDAKYTPLLGAASVLTGLSLQTNLADFSNVFPDTLTWVQNSASAGKPWVVACDEPGDAQHALRPAGDEGNSWIDGRKNALWGNVMAGGAGVEFYFGYQHDESDLNLQNFRSRDGFWNYCRHLLDFFRDNQVRFQNMNNENALVSNTEAWCLRKPGEAYVVYLKNGGTTNLDLTAATGDFDVRWFDPRNGGALQQGSVTSVTGGATVSLGQAPSSTTSDWTVYVSKTGSGGGNTIDGVMQGLLNDTDVRSDGILLATNATALVPGRSGTSGGVDRSSILVFQLPDLGNVANPFTAATLGFNVETVSTNPPGVNLYGLGKKNTADVAPEDYWGETPTLDTTDATLIQSNILSGSTGTGFKNSSASTALAGYLNTQYESGVGAGKFVFLRLSTTAPITGLLRHYITSADAAGTNGPRVAYNAIAPPDFDTWTDSFSFAAGADLTPEGDPDGDGQSTRFEYLFGLDPSSGTSVTPITAALHQSAGTFRYTRRNPALTRITDFQIWTSGNLADWEHDDAALQSTDDVGEIQEVTVTLSAPKPLDAPSLFIQVRAIE